MAMPKRGSSGRHPQRPPSPIGGRSAARQLPGLVEARSGTRLAERWPGTSNSTLFTGLFHPLSLRFWNFIDADVRRRGGLLRATASELPVDGLATTHLRHGGVHERVTRVSGLNLRKCPRAATALSHQKWG
eukprot:1961124-Prymnesium_polylepis.3